MSTPADALAHLLEVLDRMAIPYAVGGSVAGSARGIPGTTLDVDPGIDLDREEIEDFAALQPEFYADAA